MASEPDYMFDHQEVAEALIRVRGIHEGLWRLVVEVGLSAANVNVLNEGKTTLTPTGMVLIQRIGIMKADEPNDLTVDASVVNPRETASSTKRRKKRQK